MRKNAGWRIAIFLAIAISQFPLRGAYRGEGMAYFGGSVTSITKNQNGILDLSDPTELRFRYGQSVFAVPYSRITGLEFGPAMVSKAKKNYLTIGFTTEQGATEVMVFEITRNLNWTTLPVLESRTNHKVEMLGEEASGGDAEVMVVGGPASLPNEPASPDGKPTLAIRSNPDGAEVQVNGAKAGVTPMAVALDLQSGLPYAVRIKKPGYQTQVYFLVAMPGAYTLRVALPPVPTMAGGPQLQQ